VEHSELVPINQLKLDPQNVRKHSGQNLAAIQASLKQFGQQRPILAMRDRTVIAGNGTLAAARALGWTEIEVKWTDLTGAEARAYAIADNRSAELAEWDLPALKDALQELDTGAFEMDATGFDSAALEELMTATIPEQEVRDRTNEFLPIDYAFFLLIVEPKSLGKVQETISVIAEMEGVRIENTYK
jgi:ParB-like chromosome segregation protein Spo0J